MVEVVAPRSSRGRDSFPSRDATSVWLNVGGSALVAARIVWRNRRGPPQLLPGVPMFASCPAAEKPRRRAGTRRDDGVSSEALAFDAIVAGLDTPAVRRRQLRRQPNAMGAWSASRRSAASILEVALYTTRLYEKDTVPEDAQVVAERTTRSRMPVVLYAVLEIGLTPGLKVTLQVSSRDAAARFAGAFGAEEIREEAAKAEGGHKQGHEKEGGKRTRAYYASLTMKEKARIASAYATLGLKKGASMGEIQRCLQGPGPCPPP